MKGVKLLKTEIRRMEKINALAPIYEKVRASQGTLRINDFWDDHIKNTELALSKTWNTRAWFLQVLDRFCPDDIQIIKAQKAGTFAKKI